MSRISYLMAVGLLASATVALPASERTISESDMVYSFEDIPVSSNLTWTPCYERFHCANLEVPLDYEDASAGTTIVAWVRQEAANSTGQDILFNPGGPGASGVDQVLSGAGDSYIKQLGGKYNLVTFDPRGVNNSGPAPTCFPDDPDSRDLYATTRSLSAPFNEVYSRLIAEGQWCTKANNGTNTRYFGTLAVVQDMMHFTELQAALDGKDPKETKIWYFGVSYGTLIGQTLAATYPDRIGRIIVDANVNGESYYNGMIPTAIEDSNVGFQLFFENCAEAGPEKCAFAGNSTTAEEIKDRFNKLLENLEKEPIVVLAGVPTIATKSTLLSQAFQSLYSPIATFPRLATVLADLENRNATSLMTSGGRGSDPGPFNYTSIAVQEVLKLVTSVDAAGRYPIKNVDDYLVVAENLTKNYYYGEIYAKTNILIAAGMDIIPPKSQIFTGFKKTKTDTPILFINTVGDPVTPLSSAKHMSEYFEGSVVLVQNSGGHSFTSVPSKCTHSHVVTYLENGTLPEDGTVCEVDQKPLVDTPTQAQKIKREVFEHLF